MDQSMSKWKVMIADDEKEIHSVTKLVLSRFEFENKKIELISTYNFEQTISVLRENSDIAILLLDVVMEKEDSGLQVIRTIRNELNNHTLRIIIRTGQPGYAPETKIIKDYDINDYWLKTEMTKQKLYTSLVTALRSYRDIITLNNNLIEKVLLINEIQHRVKGNLQLISSILNIQIEKITNKEDRYFFQEAISKIHSIALVHEMLYNSENFAQINLGNYSQKVAELLIFEFNENEFIELIFKTDSVMLDIDSSISIGLIINELVLNSIKHAFKDQSNNQIQLEIFCESKSLFIKILDNGTGLPANFSIEQDAGMGLHIVSGLCEQLKSSISFKSSEDGTLAQVIIPISENMEVGVGN